MAEEPRLEVLSTDSVDQLVKVGQEFGHPPHQGVTALGVRPASALALVQVPTTVRGPGVRELRRRRDPRSLSGVDASKREAQLGLVNRELLMVHCYASRSSLINSTMPMGKYPLSLGSRT